MAVGGKSNDEIARLLLDADQYKAELNNVAKEIRKHARSQKNLKIVTDEYEKTLKKAAKSTTEAARATEENTVQLKKADRSLVNVKAGYDLVIGSIRKFIGITDQILTNGLRMNKLWQANTLAIDKAREATKGFLTDEQLLVASNKAVAFNMGLTADQFARLAKGAAVASQKIGGDTVKSVDDLITGMARLSKPILDNLGIMISVKSASEEYAIENNKLAKNLTDAEKKQAFMNAAIKDLERIAGNSQIKVKDLGAAYVVLKNESKNAWDAFSVWIANKKFLLGTFGDIASGLREIIKEMRGLEDASIGAAQAEMDARAQALQKKLKTLNKTPTMFAFQFTKSAKAERDAKIKAIKQQLAGIKIQREELGIRRSVTREANRQLELMNLQAVAALKLAKGKKDKKPLTPTKKKKDPLAFLKLPDDLGGKKVQDLSAKLLKEYELKSKPPELKFGKTDDTVGPAPTEDPFAELKATEAAFDAFKTKVLEASPGMNMVKALFPPGEFESLMGNFQSLDDVFQNMITSTLDGVQKLGKTLAKALFQAVKAEESVAKAMQKALSSFLSAFGQQMAMEALGEAAAAIKELASGNPAGAGLHAAAAVAYGAAAALAGVASNAVAPAADKASSSASSRGVGGAAAPTTPGGGQNSYTFNINSYGEPPDQFVTMLADGLTKGVNEGKINPGAIGTA